MIARVSIEVIGEIPVENSIHFEGVKIPSMPDDYVPSEVNNIKRELENPGQWSRYFHRKISNKKGGNNYVHHALPTGARPVPANE